MPNVAVLRAVVCRIYGNPPGWGGADIRRPPSVCGAGEIQNTIATQFHRRQAGVTLDASTTKR